MPALRRSDIEALTAMHAALHDGRARQTRLAHGLSLTQMGGGCSVSHAAVSRWEAGTRKPRGATALRYARLLVRLGLHAEASA